LKTYELEFHEAALKEWRKLDNATRDQFKSKLAERLQNPEIPSARLHGARRLGIGCGWWLVERRRGDGPSKGSGMDTDQRRCGRIGDANRDG
jgi:hypothetical protein